MLLLLAAAAAYETDQLTARDAPLEDSLPFADAAVAVALERAIETTNRATRCDADPRQTRLRLARAIHRELARPEYVASRAFPAGLGFSAAAAQAERTFPVRRFEDADDIYDEVALTQSAVLWAVGPCSTLRIGPIQLGTDKLDHFWELGWRYAVRSGWGAHPERAVDWGTRTELGVYGLATSQVFSFADLRANWQGYRFYTGLLEEGSVVVQGDDGCLELARPFTWTEWIDEDWDEALDPPAYRRSLSRAVAERLHDDHDAYCRVWEELREVYEDRREARTGMRPWVGRRAPAQEDPWGLDAMCGPPPTEADTLISLRVAR